MPSDVAKISVLCVDDNPLICSAMQRWLGKFKDLRFVGSVERAADAGTAVDRLHPDVVLMDVDMPGEDPFRIVTTLTEHNPDLRIAMFSGMARPEYISRAIECGAMGYICKDETPDVIARSIEALARGDFVLTPLADAAVRNA